MRDTILAIIELDRFPDEVAARAAWLAKLYGCKLHLFLSDPTIGVLRRQRIVSNAAKTIADDITAAQEGILAELSAAVSNDGDLAVTSVISNDRPASDAIIAAALDLEPRMVVKGTHYHGPAARATFADVDWQLIRKLDFPLWLVKPNEWQDAPTVVAAVDPTHADDENGELDRNIISFGKELTERTGGKLILLHTYERLAEIGDYAMFSFKPVEVPVEEIDERLRTEHQEKLDALAGANEIASDDVHLLPGRAREILPSFARTQGANLVIMGAVSRTGKRLAIGSTAQQVLDHLHSDILVARNS